MEIEKNFLFSEKKDLLDSFVMHIPHASTHIPIYDNFILENIEHNMNLLTDWGTDKIFNIDNITNIITPFSRLFCDVERFEDELEPMSKIGRGFYYTNGYDDNELRFFNVELKSYIYENFYKKHHDSFEKIVTEKYNKYNICHIIDCHSFNDNPIIPFKNNCESPDICIGTDSFHTPQHLVDYSIKFFREAGFTVKVNDPYEGCIIPQKYYLKNPDIVGIMIEINKKLYMDDDIINNEKIVFLNKKIENFIHNFYSIV